MYSTMVFKRPSIEDKIITEKFDLDFVMKNDRTTIYESKNARFSFDKSVIRVMVYDGKNRALTNEIEEFFYNG